jgi:hypothetical protein
VAQERVGLDPELQQIAPLPPPGAEHVALEAHVVGLGGRERGEVVPPLQQFRAGVQRVTLHPPRPPQGAPVLEGRPLAAVQDAVAVRARARVAAGVEAVGRRRAAYHRDVVRQQRVQRAGLGRRAGVRRDLPPRVHPAIGPPGHRERHLAAEHHPQRPLELALHGPVPGLPRPAGERAAVVLDVQPRGRHAARV